MSSKMKKLLLEIERTREKRSILDVRLNELEKQKTELENFEIVELVRKMKVSTSDLTEFLTAFREKSETPIILKSQEDNQNEKP